jgi:beta-lactamase superfamily II metal-dependent hydrolase
MSSSFRVEMLPAREGDCLLVSYRDEAARRDRHVLIDGGRKATWPTLKERLSALPEEERELELLVVTHVDRDHIEGVLEMFRDANRPVMFKEVWFNAYRHLSADESYGPAQGEELSAWLADNAVSWNARFDGRAVRVSTDGSLPTFELEGGLALTVLSPTQAKLSKLIPVWEDECKKSGIKPGDGYEIIETKSESFGAIDVDALADSPDKRDSTEANGSSIALLATYAGRSVLLAADAHLDVLEASIDALRGAGKLALAALKVSHHGSKHNTTTSLLKKLACKTYLVSTNGSQFGHPDDNAIARIIRDGRAEMLIFNYRTEQTKKWDRKSLKEQHGYDVAFGNDGWIEVSI